jgi:hypothetical protein
VTAHLWQWIATSICETVAADGSFALVIPRSICMEPQVLYMSNVRYLRVDLTMTHHEDVFSHFTGRSAVIAASVVVWQDARG